MPVIHKTWKVKIVTEAMNLAGQLQWDKRQIPSIGGLIGEGSRPVVLCGLLVGSSHKLLIPPVR